MYAICVSMYVSIILYLLTVSYIRLSVTIALKYWKRLMWYDPNQLRFFIYRFISHNLLLIILDSLLGSIGPQQQQPHHHHHPSLTSLSLLNQSATSPPPTSSSCPSPPASGSDPRGTSGNGLKDSLLDDTNNEPSPSQELEESSEDSKKKLKRQRRQRTHFTSQQLQELEVHLYYHLTILIIYLFFNEQTWLITFFVCVFVGNIREKQVRT